MSPYRHPAPMPGLTARAWRVSEWQKVYVRLCVWLPWTEANARWKRIQARRLMGWLNGEPQGYFRWRFRKRR